MGIVTVGDGLKIRLQTITSIKQVFAPDEIPESTNVFPAAVILVGASEFHLTHDGGHTTNYRVIILMGKQDTPSALARLLPYIDESGVDSVEAAIVGDRTLGGAASDCIVTNNTGMGFTTIGGHTYLSTEFAVKVLI